MPKTPQRKNRTFARSSLRFSLHRRGHVLILALLFGVVGTYMLVLSNAQGNSVPDNAMVIVGVGNTSPSAQDIRTNDSTYNESDNTATYNSKVDFQKGAVPLYLFSPIGVYLDADGRRYRNLIQVDEWHISISLQMYVKVTDVICAPGYTCQIDRSGYSAGDGGRVDKVQMMDMCINLTRQDYNKAFTLLTLNVDPSTAVKRPYGPDWTVQTTAERNRCVPTDQLSKTDGNLAYNRGYDWHNYVLAENGNSSATGSNRGAWGTNGTPTGQTNLVQPGREGSGNTGTGSDGVGTGGAGGGGSSATTQGDNYATIPSTTSQGDNSKQPKLEPSPFFDGKLFAAGSDVLGTVDTVSIGGIKVGYSWFYLGGALVILGISGLIGWKYRQKLRPALASVMRTLHLK